MVTRQKDALRLLLEARLKTERFVDDVKIYIQEDPELVGVVKKFQRGIQVDSPHPESLTSSDGKASFLGYTGEAIDDIAVMDDPSISDQRKSYRQGLVQRLRDAHIFLHKIYFSLGDIYHVMGRGAEEAESYGTAELIRQSILER